LSHIPTGLSHIEVQRQRQRIKTRKGFVGHPNTTWLTVAGRCRSCQNYINRFIYSEDPLDPSFWRSFYRKASRQPVDLGHPLTDFPMYAIYPRTVFVPYVNKSKWRWKKMVSVPHITRAWLIVVFRRTCTAWAMGFDLPILFSVSVIPFINL
jgi:hypothetical protein